MGCLRERLLTVHRGLLRVLSALTAGWILGCLPGTSPEARGAVLPHAPLIPTAAELSRLARVRALLASSTQENPNLVRIRFYGQSITLAHWWQLVAARLRVAYPNANLDIDNLAISGFQDWALDRTVAVDMVPVQPDLVILHAFGDGILLKDVVHVIRTGTTSEVLLQQDYVLGYEPLDEDTNPATITFDNLLSYRNYVSLPEAADSNGACLARIHDPWKDYCRTNGVIPASMLEADGVHPGDDANELLAELTLAYLLPDGTPPALDPWNCSTVQTLDFASQPVWRDGQLECDVSGRVIELGFKSMVPANVEVFIDGVRPSRLPELYGFNRVSPTQFSQWPAVSQIGSLVPLVEEDWTLTPFNITADGQGFNFRVSGSITGDDGVGTNKMKFTSRSRRVVIEPGDHWLDRSVFYSGGNPIQHGYSAHWKALFRGMDRIDMGTRPGPRLDGDILTLALGLSEGVHRLTLWTEPGSEKALRFLRVRSPAGQARIANAAPPPEVLPPGALAIRSVPGRILLSWSHDPGWKLVTSSARIPLTLWRDYPQVLLHDESDHMLVSIIDPDSQAYFKLVPVGTNP